MANEKSQSNSESPLVWVRTQIPKSVRQQAKANAAICNKSFDAFLRGIIEQAVIPAKKKTTNHHG